MTKTVEAIYEDKVLKPLSPLEGLQEHQRVKVIVDVSQPKVASIKKNISGKYAGVGKGLWKEDAQKYVKKGRTDNRV